MNNRPKGFKARLRRMFASDSELEAQELAKRADEHGATALSDCQGRCKVVVVGQIASVTIDKQGGWLEAEVSDGTGSVVVVWMGRKQIPGVVAGHSIKVSGRLSSRAGGKVIYNPEYQLLAS